MSLQSKLTLIVPPFPPPSEGNSMRSKGGGGKPPVAEFSRLNIELPDPELVELERANWLKMLELDIETLFP